MGWVIALLVLIVFLTQIWHLKRYTSTSVDMPTIVSELHVTEHDHSPEELVETAPINLATINNSVDGQPATARISQTSRESVNAATARFHAPVKVIVKIAGSPAVVLPPIGKVVKVSRIAVNAATV